MTDAKQEIENKLLEDVRSARNSGGVVSAVLKTDERVFARITDGIYREPASALRELIANAYDADASEVRIDTDMPRFSRIVVRDNGHGLTEEALVHVICHIGGSLKRTKKGVDFNVASEADPTRSPGGRKLIGKLGIGLFSVSQLTHRLVIVTKVKGESVRRVCDIVLIPQTDAPQQKSATGDEEYITGKAQIKSMPAEDVDSHGTEITLLDIRPFVKESLQSQALWSAISSEPDIDVIVEEDLDSEQAESELVQAEVLEDIDEFYVKPPVPYFHIGRVSKRDPELFVEGPVFPWDRDDSPAIKFEKLVSGVSGLAADSNEKVRLTEVLDSYFKTLWTLSLSVPLPYIGLSPFEISGSDHIPTYAISNKGARSKAELVELAPDEAISQRLGLAGDDINKLTPFSVLIDDIEIKRPLEFKAINNGADSIPPMLFVGRLQSDLKSIAEGYSGGPIEFDAYFYWQQKIVPADHNGIMIRINGASGILFDDGFLKYQISELTRLRQISAEIYIKRGLDAALNIDRESFNIAHTHYQVLKKWVHHALRQVMSRQKSVSGAMTATRLEDGLSLAVDQLNEIVGRSDGDTENTRIIFSATPLLRSEQSGIVFDKEFVFSPRKSKRSPTKSDRLKEDLLEEQIKAVAEVLQSYRVFDSLPESSRDELLRKVVAIFSVELRK